jgi:hypothetical protein
MTRSCWVLAFALAGCSNPFAAQIDGIGGNITRFGDMDHSGTDVALVVAYDNGEPGIDDDIALLADGVETEIERPVMHVPTDNAGNYNLKDPPNGTFFMLISHPGFAPFVRPQTLTISHGHNGRITVEDIVLTRVSFTVQGTSFTPGQANADGSLQAYMVNDKLGIFDTTTGVWNRVPSDLPLAGATFAPVGDNVLFHTGATGTTAEASVVLAGKGRAAMAVPGGDLPAVTALSTNTREAYIGPDGTHFVLFNPNGNGTNVDIRTGAFSSPEALTVVASDVSAVEYVADPSFRQQFLVSQVFKQFAFDSNARDIPLGAGTVAVRDFSTLDPNTGMVTTFSQVQGTTSSVTHPVSGDVFRLFRTVTDNAGNADLDFYLFQPGSTPVKLNATPLRGTFTADATTTPGKIYLFVSGATESQLYVFDLALQHNFQLLATLTGNVSSFAAGARRIGDRLLFLTRNGAAVNLDALDPKTGAKTTVQAGITQAGGGTINTTVANANVSRVLATGVSLFNMSSNGGTFGLVVVDTTGAHPIQGTYSTATWNAAMAPTLSADGSTLLFYDPTATTGGIFSAPLATGAPAGPIPNTASNATLPPNVMAISGNGAIIGYATQVTTVVTPHTVTGGIDTPRTPWTNANSLPATKMVVTQNGVFLSDALGAGYVTELTNNTFATLSALIANGLTLTFADGQRMLASASTTAGTTRYYEINFNSNLTTTPPQPVNGNITLSINGPRTRAFILTSAGIRALASDGSADTSITGAFFQSLQILAQPVPTSPSGRVMYFSDNAGRIVAYNETGAPIQLSTAVQLNQNAALLPGNTDFIYMDTAMNGVRTLAVANLDTAARTDVVKGVVNTGFQSNPGLGPFMVSDGKSMVAAGDLNAGIAGMKPSLQLAAYNIASKSVVVLGNNIARTPLPSLDTKRVLRYQGDQDSLTGTFTAYSWPSGGAAATTVASKVRALLVSADGMANAVITVDGTKTKLGAGATGQPAVEMGEFNATRFSAGLTCQFSGDNTRLYAIASGVAPGGGSTGGDLVTGTIGMPGIKKLAPGALFSNPDRTGKAASVLLLRGLRPLGLYREQ